MADDYGIPPRVQQIVEEWRAGNLDRETATELFRKAMLDDRERERRKQSSDSA